MFLVLCPCVRMHSPDGEIEKRKWIWYSKFFIVAIKVKCWFNFRLLKHRVQMIYEVVRMLTIFNIWIWCRFIFSASLYSFFAVIIVAIAINVTAYLSISVTRNLHRIWASERVKWTKAKKWREKKAQFYRSKLNFSIWHVVFCIYCVRINLETLDYLQTSSYF